MSIAFIVRSLKTDSRKVAIVRARQLAVSAGRDASTW